MIALPQKKWLLLIVSFSFLASLAYSFYYRIYPVVDAGVYDKIAQHILIGRGYVEDLTKAPLYDHAITKVGPLYEYFLAAVYKIFGHYYEVVWVIQALLHALTALLLFLICKDVFKDRGEIIGLIAAAAIGFHPDLIEISAMLMIETAYLFFVTLTLWCFVKLYYAPKDWGFLVMLAISTGIAIFFRPPIALFLPVFVVFYLMRREYARLAVFSLLLAAIFTPWVIRNYRIYYQFIPTTLVSAHNLWVGNTIQSDGGQIGGGYNPSTEYTEKFGYAGFGAKADQEFLSFVLARPVDFVKLTAVRTMRYFSLIRPMGFWFYQNGIRQVFFVASSAAAIAVLFILGFAGMAMSLKLKNNLLNYLIVLALTAPLPLVFTVVQSRYRFQIYPFLAVFGAYAAVALWHRVSGTWKYVVRIGAILISASAIDAVLFMGKILARLSGF